VSVLGNQEAVQMDMSPNEVRSAIRGYLSGSKPRMHSYEPVWWNSCSEFKHCAMMPEH
jgi:hypothetical protein